MKTHGSCLSFPVRADNRGTLKTVSDRDAIIEQSIRSIIETRQGERVMMPDYGIPDYAFNVMDVGLVGRLAIFLEQQIARYEPLVEVIKVRAGTERDGQFTLSLVDAHRAAVLIEYRARGSNTPRNLIYPVWQLSAQAA